MGVRFTAETVGAIAVPDGKAQVVVFDASMPGFGLKVNRGGARQWVVQYRDPTGRTRRQTVGRIERLSLADARKQARDILNKASKGGDPHAEKAAAKVRMATTFGTLVPRYLAVKEARLRPATVRDLRHSLNVQFGDLHPLPVSDITRALVAAQIATVAVRKPPEKGKRTQGGLQAASRARVVLSTFFVWAMGEGLAEANPVISTNKPAPAVSRDRVLTNAELLKVWNAAGSDDDFGRIVRLLILTGQRRDEVASMRWSELDLAGAMWRLPAERTKNKRPHDVPLAPAAVNILFACPAIEGREFVFGRHGKSGFSGFSKLKIGLDKAAGLASPWRLHDLRRTAVTGMAALGINLPVVERIVNHVSGSFGGIVGVYQRHDYAVEKREALERWAEHLLALLKEDRSSSVL